MQFKVIVDFYEINIIEINVDDPETAARAVLKLYNEGQIKPEINKIAVCDLEDEFGLSSPIFVLEPPRSKST